MKKTLFIVLVVASSVNIGLFAAEATIQKIQQLETRLKAAKTPRDISQIQAAINKLKNPQGGAAPAAPVVKPAAPVQRPAPSADEQRRAAARQEAERLAKQREAARIAEQRRAEEERGRGSVKDVNAEYTAIADLVDEISKLLHDVLIYATNAGPDFDYIVEDFTNALKSKFVQDY
jgi:hypothetical protein